MKRQLVILTFSVLASNVACAATYDRVGVTSSTTGTGTITLGSAISGPFQNFSSAAVTDGSTVSYIIIDGTAWETGAGTYSPMAGTLTRVPLHSSNSNAAINLDGSEDVYLALNAADLNGFCGPAGTLPCPVVNGGTGLANLTLNTIYKGNGTSPETPSGISDSGTTISFGEPWTATVPDVGTGGQTIFSIDGPGTTTTGPFQLAGLSFGGNPDGQPDIVMNLGWNIGNNGAPLDTSQPASRIGWESHYDLSPSNPDMELHLASFYTPLSPNEYRAISVLWEYELEQSIVLFGAEQISFSDSTNTNEYMYCQPNSAAANAGGICTLNYGRIYAAYNNSYVTKQMNAEATSALPLPYINSSDHLQVNQPINATGGLNSSGTANSTSITLGDIVTAGGVGIAQNLTLGGTLGMTPATWADTQTCTAGQIAVDANYIYVCTATNTVKRAALSSF